MDPTVAASLVGLAGIVVGGAITMVVQAYVSNRESERTEELLEAEARRAAEDRAAAAEAAERARRHESEVALVDWLAPLVTLVKRDIHEYETSLGRQPPVDNPYEAPPGAPTQLHGYLGSCLRVSLDTALLPETRRSLKKLRLALEQWTALVADSDHDYRLLLTERVEEAVDDVVGTLLPEAKSALDQDPS